MNEHQEWLSSRHGMITASSASKLAVKPRNGGLNAEQKRIIAEAMCISPYEYFDSLGLMENPNALEDAEWYKDHLDAMKAISSPMEWGHYFEATALAEFNERTGLELIHCEDFAIRRGRVQASPDALSEDSTTAVEIKCLQPTGHLAALRGEPVDIKDRLWQMATLFYCEPKLETCYLAHYSPLFDNPCDLSMNRYSRSEFLNELEMITEHEKTIDAGIADAKKLFEVAE